jgi:hypothetical protein
MRTLSNLILTVGLLLPGYVARAQPPVPVTSSNPPSAATASFPPQTVHQKFVSYAIVTVGPRAIFNPLIPAAYLMLVPPDRYPREWRQGARAFGRNYGDQLATVSALQTARFATGAILHEDLRYRPSANNHLMARAGHALAYTFVDKSDSGHARIAFANFLGAAAGGYVGRLYLPSGFNDVSHADSRAAILFGVLGGRNLVQEFTPDVLRFTRKLHFKLINVIPLWWKPIAR